MEQEVIRISMASAEFKKQVTTEVTKLRMEKEQGDDSSIGRDKREFYKPITEYEAILDMGKLTNDKSGFRDRKIRMKDALVQVFRGR